MRIKGCIKDSFLFQSLDAKTLKIVIDSMEERTAGPGEAIITQGADGNGAAQFRASPRNSLRNVLTPSRPASTRTATPR